jgi:hypothetical protein
MSEHRPVFPVSLKAESRHMVNQYPAALGEPPPSFPRILISESKINFRAQQQQRAGEISWWLLRLCIAEFGRGRVTRTGDLNNNRINSLSI